MANEAGAGGGLGGLFQNRLFQSMLLGMGSSLNPQGISPALNQTLQPVIAAQSQNKLNEHYIKMLSQILGGKVPAGGKMTMDDKGTKFQIPPPGTQEGGGGGGLMGSLGGVQQPNFPATPSFNPAEILNPSNSLPELSASDLAGLSSKDVSAALGGALDVQELMRRTIADAAGIPYQEAKTAEAWAHTQKLLTPDDEPLNRPFPIEMPGVGPITMREWNSLPQDQKEYAAYVHTAKQLGDSDIMSRKEFDLLKPTERQRFLEYLMANPEAMSAEKELRSAASVAAGEKPDRVTWTTATKELTKRFGKLDATGMWAVTPELQFAHRESQRMLTELRDEGVEPLKAVNEAEDRARRKQQLIEKRYQQYLDIAKGIKNSSKREEKLEEIKSLFYKRYGYIPAEIR